VAGPVGDSADAAIRVWCNSHAASHELGEVGEALGKGPEKLPFEETVQALLRPTVAKPTGTASVLDQEA
jgi:hypothetical protein